MKDQTKQCDICPWPLDCAPEMKAAKPAEADCPRDVCTWERQPRARVTPAEATPLDNVADLTLA